MNSNQNASTPSVEVDEISTQSESPSSDDQATYRGVNYDTILDWYTVNQQGRILEERAVGYIRKAKGWSYHAPFAGHDGIQLILGKAFRSTTTDFFKLHFD